MYFTKYDICASRARPVFKYVNHYCSRSHSDRTQVLATYQCGLRRFSTLFYNSCVSSYLFSVWKMPFPPSIEVDVGGPLPYLVFFSARLTTPHSPTDSCVLFVLFEVPDPPVGVPWKSSSTSAPVSQLHTVPHSGSCALLVLFEAPDPPVT